MYSKIQAIEYYLPKRVLTNSDLEEKFEKWDSSKIEKKVGIKNRHIADENETSLELGLVAAKKILYYVNKEDIDFVLFCTQSPEYFLPSGSCVIQERLGLRKNIGAFDINLGCSGYTYGLAIADSLIKNKIANNVLFITAETYSKYINPSDIGNLSVFGDGAAATFITGSERNKILSFELGTDGAGYDKLIVRSGAMNKNSLDDEESKYLYMDGPDIFNFTMEVVPKLVNDVLNKNFMVINDIDMFIFHQANKYILNYLRKKIGIPKEKFYVNLIETGNTVSSTLPIALKQCLDDKIIKSGDKVMLIGFGVGLSWGGVVIEI